MARINSIAKGKDGERELANILRDEYKYDTRRGQQHSGIEGDDVVGLPGIHIECKRVEALNLDKAMEQSIRDTKNRDEEIPAVFHRKNRKPWKVTILLEDFMKLYKEAYKHENQ